MSLAIAGVEREALIYRLSAYDLRGAKRLDAAPRKEPEDVIVTGEDPQSQKSFSVPEQRGIEDLGRAIAAAAGDSPEGSPSDLPASSARGLPKVKEGWLLMRAFLSIRSDARRRAVLQYVVEQANIDNE